MRNFRTPFLAALGLVSHLSLATDRLPLKPGEYFLEGGWGKLVVQKEGDKGTAFSIDSIGENARSCSIKGVIKHAQAMLSTDDGGEKCAIDFAPSNGNVKVIPKADMQCHQFCGLSTFGGLYLRTSKECESDARAASYKNFKQLYKKKEYVTARRELDPILKSCKKVLHWPEVSRVSNDLAITQYHLKDYAGCLRTLKPLMNEAAMTDEELENLYWPGDFDTKIAYVAATRTNFKLCSEKLRKR